MRGNASNYDRSLLRRFSADYGSLISRRQSEQALRGAAVESALASRAKSEFLSNMSHELRTPLNAIIGFSELMQHIGADGRVDQKILEYAGHISHAGRHLLGIVNDILDMSKIESGTFELDLILNSIEDALGAAVAIVQPRIDEKKQRLSIQIAKNIPLFEFDRRRVIQIVLNLVTNAHKFTREGGAITLAATQEGHSVLVAVVDTGIGMTNDQVNHALKPFAQVQSSFSRDHEGTGLGLPLTKALVEQHRGTFVIASEPQVGTRTAFLLPMSLLQIPPISQAKQQPSLVANDMGRTDDV
jgi:two-component system, cell cycle sensor histidine kinase PleC